MPPRQRCRTVTIPTAFAGAMSFADGLAVVRERGRAMQAAAVATPSGMVSALLLEPGPVEEIVKEASSAGRIWIANYLCPGNTVLSGEVAAIDAAEKLIEAKSGKPVRLSVAGAFHTDLMKPADEQLAEALASAGLRTPRIPIYSNVTAAAHGDDTDAIGRALATQVTRGVLWEASMRRMLADGFDTFYEVGPGRVLTGLLKRIDRKVPCTSVPAR